MLVLLGQCTRPPVKGQKYDFLFAFHKAPHEFAGCQIHSPLIRLTTYWEQMMANVNCSILGHDARVTVRYISLHYPLNKAWVIIRLICTSPHLSQHGPLPELCFVSVTVWALVIWHLWEAVLGVEFLTSPYGSGGIKCIKNAKSQGWNWSAMLDGCRCEPDRGDYMSLPPLI